MVNGKFKGASADYNGVADPKFATCNLQLSITKRRCFTVNIEILDVCLYSVVFVILLILTIAFKEKQKRKYGIIVTIVTFIGLLIQIKGLFK